MIVKQEKSDQLFLELKGTLIEFINQLDIAAELSFEKSNKITYLEPNYQAIIKQNDQVIGEIGIVEEEVKENWDISKNTVLFVLDFKSLQKMAISKKLYKPLAKYPSVTRDLSFWINKDFTVAGILKALKEAGIRFAINFEVTDIYPHKRDKEKQSVSIHVTLRSRKKTLAEEDIKQSMTTVLEVIGKLGGKLRKK